MSFNPLHGGTHKFPRKKHISSPQQSRFLTVIAFPKPMRHSTLNNRDSGLETMAITIVIVLTTIPERQIFTFPIVLAIVLPPYFLWFKIQCPFDFLCELKKFASVSSHVSSHMAILLRNFCILLLFAFMAWFEISDEIERRFYQEALSPDLKWRKQGLASLGRCCLIENAISPPNSEVFKPASKSGYPNIWCVDIFKKIWESSSSFLSWLRFMKVGKVEKNFHTFLLSSSLIHHLIGP